MKTSINSISIFPAREQRLPEALPALPPAKRGEVAAYLLRLILILATFFAVLMVDSHKKTFEKPQKEELVLSKTLFRQNPKMLW